MGEINDDPVITLIQTEDACVSAICVWETVIKHGRGKMPLRSNEVKPTMDIPCVRPQA